MGPPDHVRNLEVLKDEAFREALRRYTTQALILLDEDYVTFNEKSLWGTLITTDPVVITISHFLQFFALDCISKFSTYFSQGNAPEPPRPVVYSS